MLYLDDESVLGYLAGVRRLTATADLDELVVNSIGHGNCTPREAKVRLVIFGDGLKIWNSDKLLPPSALAELASIRFRAARPSHGTWSSFATRRKQHAFKLSIRSSVRMA